jgi:hypothetical protein
MSVSEIREIHAIPDQHQRIYTVGDVTSRVTVSDAVVEFEHRHEDWFEKTLNVSLVTGVCYWINATPRYVDATERLAQHLGFSLLLEDTSLFSLTDVRRYSRMQRNKCARPKQAEVASKEGEEEKAGQEEEDEEEDDDFALLRQFNPIYAAAFEAAAMQNEKPFHTTGFTERVFHVPLAGTQYKVIVFNRCLDFSERSHAAELAQGTHQTGQCRCFVRRLNDTISRPVNVLETYYDWKNRLSIAEYRSENKLFSMVATAVVEKFGALFGYGQVAETHLPVNPLSYFEKYVWSEGVEPRLDGSHEKALLSAAAAADSTLAGSAFSYDYLCLHAAKQFEAQMHAVLEKVQRQRPTASLCK